MEERIGKIQTWRANNLRIEIRRIKFTKSWNFEKSPVLKCKIRNSRRRTLKSQESENRGSQSLSAKSKSRNSTVQGAFTATQSNIIPRATLQRMPHLDEPFNKRRSRYAINSTINRGSCTASASSMPWLRSRLSCTRIRAALRRANKSPSNWGNLEDFCVAERMDI